MHRREAGTWIVSSSVPRRPRSAGGHTHGTAAPCIQELYCEGRRTIRQGTCGGRGQISRHLLLRTHMFGNSLYVVSGVSILIWETTNA